MLREMGRVLTHVIFGPRFHLTDVPQRAKPNTRRFLARRRRSTTHRTEIVRIGALVGEHARP